MVRDSIEEALDRLYDIRDMYEAELSGMPDGKLLCMRNNDKVRFYHALRKNGKYERKGITRDKELIRMLARKEFVSKALVPIYANISTLEKALGKYKPCDPDTIAGKLTKTFSNVSSQDLYASTVDTVLMTLDIEDVKRIGSHAKWGNEPYSPPDYKAEGRTIVTSRGERMRSKAEVLIAEKLYEYGIPFRYEQPLELPEGTFHPDFTFEGANGEPFYLEFCGMMDDRGYIDAFKRKRASYEAAGIEEWRNMIYVYSSGNNMNMQEIDSVIRTKVIPLL